MSAGTKSSNWGAMSMMSATADLGLGFRGTVYIFYNYDTGEHFVFLLADLGFGLGVGARISQKIRLLFQAMMNTKNYLDPSAFTKIPANRPFSASDLNLSPGAEATVGVVVLVAGVSATLISAWPFFDGPPQAGEVNNDYFSGATITGEKRDIGLQAQAAYQFLGRWVKIW